jgi:two-component system sensor histidine kinase PilS (NtrC family)
MDVPEGGGPARWLAIGRVGVATTLAAALAGSYLAGRLPFPLAPVLALVAGSCAFSAACLVLLPRVRNPARLAEAQIYGDVVLETVLIYLTGGLYSVFPFLYLVSILTAGAAVGPRQSIGVATSAVLLHGLLLVTTFYRWLPPLGDLAIPRNVVMEGSLTILLVSGNFCASFIVAYVATHLAGRLRQARGDARRSEASLAELRTLHEDIVQSVASGLLTVDRSGLVTSVNRTAESLCQRDAASLLGASWETLFAGAPPFAEVWRRLERGPTPRTRIEAELVRADGSRIPVGMSVSFLRRDRGGIICSFQDLTEIRRMEERVRHADRLTALGRMAAGLAHEIRNPIGSIRGSVEVLRESLDPRGDDRRLMDIVLRESDRLDAIIRDFLLFSRPPRLVPVPTDLGAMLDEILLMLANQAGVQGAASRVRTVRADGALAVKVPVDPAQMRQALWNLCLNAVQAMPEGGELRVGVRELPADRGGPAAVELTVADTGVGISPADRPHLFEPFFTTKPQGTGLGLAIAHRIVEDHGGEIRVDSERGRGTRVTILLPVSEG